MSFILLPKKLGEISIDVLASETFVLVWRRRQWVERVNELSADWWNSNTVRQVLDMLHITQRSVEWGLYFNQISLIQDKIKYFFFQGTSLPQTLRTENPKSFVLKRKKTTKVTNWQFFNWSETELIFTPYSCPQYITMLSNITVTC